MPEPLPENPQESWKYKLGQQVWTPDNEIGIVYQIDFWRRSILSADGTLRLNDVGPWEKRYYVYIPSRWRCATHGTWHPPETHYTGTMESKRYDELQLRPIPNTEPVP